MQMNLKHAQSRKNSNCNVNQKEERGSHNCNHYGSYNFKNQKLGFGTRVHQLED
jgi:hypothetical protein